MKSACRARPASITSAAARCTANVACPCRRSDRIGDRRCTVRSLSRINFLLIARAGKRGQIPPRSRARHCGDRVAPGQRKRKPARGVTGCLGGLSRRAGQPISQVDVTEHTLCQMIGQSGAGPVPPADRPWPGAWLRRPRHAQGARYANGTKWTHRDVCSHAAAPSYSASRRLDSAVPIELNVVTSCAACLISVNLSAALAQLCMTLMVGSPPVFTCTV